MEFPKTVMPHSDNKCTAAGNLSPGYLQLERALHENCFEIPLQPTGSQSDGLNNNGSTNLLNSDWYGQNLETNCCGGAWEIDDIEEQLEKFAAQELNDVAAKLLQTSKEFESAALKVTGQTSSSAHDVFNPTSEDAVNSFENEALSHSVADCCSGNSVSGRIAVQSQMSEPRQAHSVKTYYDQPSNWVTRNNCLPFGTKENLERLQNVAAGSENANVSPISNLPDKKCSSVEVDHCYCVSDNVRQNLRGGINLILERDVTDCDDLPVFCFADEVDLMLKNGHDNQDELFPSLVVAGDAAIIEQSYIENCVDFNPCNADIIISDLSKENNILFEQFCSSATAADIMALLPDVNELQDCTLTGNSPVSNDQMTTGHRNDMITDSRNCNSPSIHAEGDENLLQNSTIADTHLVRPSMLLQSASSVAKDCLLIIRSPEEDATTQLSNENIREDETLKIVGADDRPTDDGMPDLRIDDVKSIKKENPFSFDDETNAEDGAQKDQDSYGLKECYCPHGYVSSNAGHFHCQECGSSTRSKNNARRHEIEKHGIRHPNIEVFPCPHCSTCFLYSSRLKRHVLTHSKLAKCGNKDDNAIIPPDFEHQKSGSRLLSTTENSGCDETFQSLAPEIKNVKKAFHSSKRLKRKSGQRSSNFKKKKPAVTSEDKLVSSKISLPKEYRLMTLIGEKMSATCHPAYDGPLLPVFLKRTKICKLCGQHFSREEVQLQHYAQVHEFCIGGIAVYQCTPCKFRTTRHCDLSRHMGTEKHRIAVGNKSEHNVSSGDAPLTDDVTQNIGCHIKKKCEQSDFKSIVNAKCIPKPSQSYETRRSNARKVSIDKYSKSCLVVKNNTLHSADLGLNAGIPKYSSKQKISQFFSLMKRDKETVESTDKFTDVLSSETVELNACVSGHSCALRCICSSNVLQGNVSSNVKVQCRNQSKVPSDLVKSNETEQRSVLTSFQNKGIEHQQDDSPNSRTISARPRPVTFYQDTTKRFQTPTLAKCLNPTSTKEDAIPLTSRIPVALKRTSCHRKKPCSTANKDSSNQTLENASESSKVPPVKTGILDTVGQFKAGAKQIMSRSSHNLLNPSPGNQTVSGNACGLEGAVLLDDDNDNFVAKDQSRSTVHVSSKSGDLESTCFNKGASLSGFSDEELFSELKRRSSLMQCCCDVYFLDSNVYNLHCAWHSEEGSLKCNFCGLNSKNWYEFYSHVLNHSK